MNWQTKLKIKHKLQIFIETVTGTGCENCRYNDGFNCRSPKHEKCTNSIFPVGFAKRKRGRK